MTEEQKTPPAPPPPKSAAEAAQRFMNLLPHVEAEKGKWVFGFYKDRKPSFIGPSMDRALVMGTMRGIAEGRVAIGDKQLLGSVNIAFNKPIVDAIDAAIARGDTEGPDVIENRKLLDRLCWGTEIAASFGIFSDQALMHNRTRHPVGFADSITSAAQNPNGAAKA